jgi:hypothetical protein
MPMPRAEVACHRCSKTGHRASDCPYKKTNNFGKESIKERFDMELFNELKDELLNNKLIKKFSGLTR